MNLKRNSKPWIKIPQSKRTMCSFWPNQEVEASNCIFFFLIKFWWKVHISVLASRQHNLHSLPFKSLSSCSPWICEKQWDKDTRGALLYNNIIISIFLHCFEHQTVSYVITFVLVSQVMLLHIQSRRVLLRDHFFEEMNHIVPFTRTLNKAIGLIFAFPWLSSVT